MWRGVLTFARCKFRTSRRGAAQYKVVGDAVEVAEELLAQLER